MIKLKLEGSPGVGKTRLLDKLIPILEKDYLIIETKEEHSIILLNKNLER